MTFPPLLRAPAVRLLLVAYPALAGILPATGRPWFTVPLCLAALAAIGALWIRAFPGLPAETGVPAARPGLAAAAGLITVPLAALAVHAAGHPVRPAPLVIACTALVTVLGAAAVLRDHRAIRRAITRPGLPAQRRQNTSPPASTGRRSGSPRHAADLPPGPASSDSPSLYGRTGSPAPEGTGAPLTPSSPAPDPDLPATLPGAGAPLLDADLPSAGRGPVRTTVAVTIPLVLAVGVGGWAVRSYVTAPRPDEPGYLSIALNGWAAAIDSPVTVPARGLVVPVRVTSAGLADTTSLLQLKVGGRVVASRPMTVAADSVRSLTVYVPALPADGLLRTVAISVGATSIAFHARGDADADGSPVTSSSAAVTGPGVRPHAPTTGAAGTTGAVGGPPASGTAVPGAGAVSGGSVVRPAPGGNRRGSLPQAPRSDGAGARPPVPAASGHAAPRPATVPQIRRHPIRPGEERPAADRPKPGTLAGLRAQSATPATGHAGGVSMWPSGVRAPSAASSAFDVAGDDGAGGPMTGLGPGDVTDGGVAGPAAPDDAGERIRRGTKGGRAMAGPTRSPSAAAVPVWPVPSGHGAQSGPPTCPGKRRAVLAGESTPC
jgi:hypothetical protein